MDEARPWARRILSSRAYVLYRVPPSVVRVQRHVFPEALRSRWLLASDDR